MPLKNSTAENGQLLQDVLLIVGGALLIAAATRVEVPFHPVPMTLQTLAVLLVGLTLGLRRGGLSVLGYIGAGAAGLPVFANGGMGAATLAGPTGGYLLGFLLAALLCGYARDRGWTRTPFAAVGCALLGAAAVYPTGLLQLGTVIGWDKPVLQLGLYPFIPGDLTKAVLAGLMATAASRFIAR